MADAGDETVTIPGQRPRLIKSFSEVILTEHADIRERRERVARRRLPLAATSSPTDRAAAAGSAATPGPSHQPTETPTAVLVSDQGSWVGPLTEAELAKRYASREEGAEQVLDQDAPPLPVMFDTIGLSLSGGGIRSAAFSLGALQGLNSAQAFDAIDYLSTVSGGGYVGCSTVAAMTKTKGEFPFGGRHDAPAMSHLRNYSNFILPRGRNGAIFESVGILVRGVLANAAYVVPIVLFLGLLAAIVPGVNVPWFEVRRLYAWDSHGHWPWALMALSIMMSLRLLLWAWLKSQPNKTVRLLPAVVAAALVFLTPALWPEAFNSLGIAMVFASGVIIFIFLQRLAWPEAIKDVSPETLKTAQAWSFYLLLAGIVEGTVLMSAGISKLEDFTRIVVGVSVFIGSIGSIGLTLATSKFADVLKALVRDGRPSFASRRVLARVAIAFPAIMVPTLLWFASAYVANVLETSGCVASGTAFVGCHNVLLLFASAIALLAFAAFGLDPNAYSLHGFYRDRLSKAFLFDPTQLDCTQAETRSFVELDKMGLHELGRGTSPYLIINIALNLQGSLKANRRGRQADFFTCTRNHVGSVLIGFLRTGLPLCRLDKRFDLATAMAISGAAVSSNMGAYSNRLMAPALSLLNLRLGYWLPNPSRQPRSWRSLLTKPMASILESKPSLLVNEMLGWIDENGPAVYLTDGGHIENLGVYELLQRGCRLVIAVDGGADAAFSFEPLCKLERFARIDLAVRIELPWDEIARSAVQAEEELRHPPISADRRRSKGPHAAMGRIYYPNGERGILLYVKASMSGNERDYVLDYMRRNPTFPHETTTDQFFSEEQFEAYRLLGRHIMYDAIRCRRDVVTILPSSRGGWTDVEAACAELRGILWTMPSTDARDDI